LFIEPLIQSTYLGGSSDDYAYSMVVSEGNIYVAGQTSSTDFPKTGEGAYHATGGGSDAFVSLLTADLKTLTQSTYLGGSSDDYAYSLVVSGGNVYVAGPTSSTNFPHTNGGAQPGTGGNGDAFVALLSADLKAISAPNVITGSATKVTVNSATLNGTVYPNGFLTTYYFEYGPTTSYGNTTPNPPQSAGSGTSDVSVSANVTGLTSNTIYHYRLVATNSLGTTHGWDMTFMTLRAPLPWLMLLLGD